MNEFDVLSAAAAGMDAQRAALDVAARNVAAAETAGDKGAFERLIPRFSVGADSPDGDVADEDEPAFESGDPGDEDDDEQDVPVRYLGATPEHGVDADAVTEMVAVLDAQRAFDANASVFDTGKRLAERTIDMGRLS